MTKTYTVVARTNGGWRATPTIQAMTLAEAERLCHQMCERFPNQEFDILGVVLQGKAISTVSLEPISDRT